MRISDCSSDVCSSDLRNLGAGAASLAVGILEAAPLLAIVRAVGIAIGPDEGAGIAHLELDVDLLRRRVRADLEGIVGAEVGFEVAGRSRSEEHTSELQSLMRISYAVFCLKNNTNIHTAKTNIH